MPVSKHQLVRRCNNPNKNSVNLFWGRRPGSVAINVKGTRVLVLEFKKSIDREVGVTVLKSKEAAANEQHSSIIEVLRAVATKWKVDQINFVIGNRGSEMEGDFFDKLEKLDVQDGERDKILFDHVAQVCEAHDRVILSYLLQIHGSLGADAKGSKDNIGQSVYA